MDSGIDYPLDVTQSGRTPPPSSILHNQTLDSNWRIRYVDGRKSARSFPLHSPIHPPREVLGSRSRSLATKKTHPPNPVERFIAIPARKKRTFGFRVANTYSSFPTRAAEDPPAQSVELHAGLPMGRSHMVMVVMMVMWVSRMDICMRHP